MNTRTLLQFVAAIGIAVAAAVPTLDAAPFGSAFTYQGRLNFSGAPAADGLYDFRFTLHDAATLGAPVGAAVDVNAVPVTNGLFTTQLDFGAPAFTSGEARWLQLEVNTNGVTPLTTLKPRQRLAPTPQAIYAGNAGTASAVAPGAVTTLGLAPDAVDGDVIFDGSISAADLAPSLLNGTFWKLGGNAGAGNFLGSLDNQPVELRVNNQPALRLLPNATSPSLIGGHSANSVNPEAHGAFIGGGGSAGTRNYVDNHYATVGGGRRNTASGEGSFVGGGTSNLNSGYVAVVGGGAGNSAGGSHTTISGGLSNQSYAAFGTVAGGVYNFLTTSATASTIGGGQENVVVQSIWSTIGGGRFNQIRNIDGLATIGGGELNVIQSSGYSGTISGGGFNLLTSGYATIGGGFNNTAQGSFSAIAGGNENVISGDSAFIGGGQTNAADGTSAVVVGGEKNLAMNDLDAIGGGGNNYVSGGASVISGGWFNQVSGLMANVGGGQFNQAAGTSATVAGGGINHATGDFSAIGGGGANEASARYATIAAGSANKATNDFATVGGGRANVAGGAAISAAFTLTDPATYSTVSGGESNRARRPHATVSGGRANTVTTRFSSIGGGIGNTIHGIENAQAGTNCCEGASAVIGGGTGNSILGFWNFNSVVAGGESNIVISPGNGATLGNVASAIGGGSQNRVIAQYATVPGGSRNQAAGDYSFAAGRRAKANHDGSLVWADDTDADFASTTNKQFAVRANNGVMIQSSATALDLRGGGGVRVAGAGVNTATPIFTHRATAANVSGAETRIDHPHCNGRPAAILITTYNFNPAGLAGTRNDRPVGLYYNGAQWAIYNLDGTAMPVGAAYNVLVANP